MQFRTALLMASVSLALVGCASQPVGRFAVGKPYEINGKTYYPEENYTQLQTGIASWYGPGFDGKRTANGERFDQDALTAAHPTLQMPSLVRVTNLENGKSLVVRVNDRGPFHSNRVMDVSKEAAKELGMIGTGTANVRLQVLGPESMALAKAAKQGIDTRGAEVAMNDTGQLDPKFASFFPTLVATPPPTVMVASNGYQPAVENQLLASSLNVPQAPIVTPQQTIAMDVAAEEDNQQVASITADAPQADIPAEIISQVEFDARVQKLPSPHKSAIFQMAPIPEANAGEMPVRAHAPVMALGEANYLPQTPKFLGMKPVVDHR